MANILQKGSARPMRLYVGSLHFNITEDMLRWIFEPFARTQSIQLMLESETGRSKGYGSITFSDSECAKKVLEPLNGFELAWRPMIVGPVTERTDASSASPFLDSDALERTGIDLGMSLDHDKTSRGYRFTDSTSSTASFTNEWLSGIWCCGGILFCYRFANRTVQPLVKQQVSNFLTCLILKQKKKLDGRHRLKPMLLKNGEVVHIYVDKISAQGNVYVKCPSTAAATAAVNALCGKWFAGKMITAANVPLPTYHSLFLESMTASQGLVPSRR